MAPRGVTVEQFSAMRRMAACCRQAKPEQGSGGGAVPPRRDLEAAAGRPRPSRPLWSTAHFVYQAYGIPNASTISAAKNG